jgi:prephenate dehydrogenase
VKRLAKARVAVVGLGLMGGSLGGALRGRCAEVVGVARRRESIEQALGRGLIDRGERELAAGAGDADVVVLATPVRVILRQLAELGTIVKAGCVLMDLGSTKRQVVQEMQELPAAVQPLGGHPMCGKEASGIEAAEATLYEGCTFVLTPLERTSPEAIAVGKGLVEVVGARAVVMDAERHDRLVATVSHLPYALACALTAAVAASAEEDPTAWELAASGFRDTSRLAASDVTMMVDILLTNRAAVLDAVGDCRKELDDLARLLEDGDEEGLRGRLRALRESRTAWGRRP